MSTRPKSAPQASHADAAPIFVLAGPFSHAALVGGMIGCNPAAFGVAELNIFVADTLEGALLEMARHDGQTHGLLRTVAQLFAGEQSVPAVAMARRWVMRRTHWPTRRVFDEIRARAAPFRIVEKSRAHLRDAESLKRMAEACPDACYVHVVSNPEIGAAGERGEDVAPFLPGSNRPSAASKPDPERVRLDVEERIAAFLATVRGESRIEVSVAELFAEPGAGISGICAKLGLPADDDAVSAMLHPEASPFARIGPAGAKLGDDPRFLQAAQLRAKSANGGSEQPPPTRADGDAGSKLEGERSAG